jgi:2'-5' RNA ligase
MRLFVAVRVGDAAVRRAEEVRRLIERLDPELARQGAKWVSAAQMHVTVRFLGEIDPLLGEAVSAALTDSVSQVPFGIGFGTPAWLPPRGRPKALVLQVAGGADPLDALRHAVEGRLPAGTPAVEPRAFRPHLTVARIRDEWRARARALQPALAGLPPVDEGGVVDAAVLFESRPGPRGPVYHERARLRLAAPA